MPILWRPEAVKWLYTVVYSGTIDADTEDEAKQAAWELHGLADVET